MMLNDEEKLILLRRVHDLEEMNVKTTSIAKENEDVSRLLRQMLRSKRHKRGLFEQSRGSPPQTVRRPRLRRRLQRNRTGEVRNRSLRST